MSDECVRFIEQATVYCAPKPRTALSMFQSLRDSGLGQLHIPTALAPLDAHLKGGIRVGTITELVGHASAGKTQLAMQLTVNAARYKQGCIYIDTEQKLSLPRLQEIAMERAKLYNHQSTFSVEPRQEHSTTLMNYKQVLANVSVHVPNNTDDLLAVLSCLEEEILARDEDASRFPVRLIVLDSIAAPIRRDFGSGSAPQRAAAVMQSAQILKRLADHYNLAIVVINQTGKKADGNTASDSDTGAALGTSWHHCVSTRIHLEQCQQLPYNAEQPIVRQCSVVKSNVVAPAEFSFLVTELGIVDMD
jgi:RecA/RadA recombinase